MDLRENISYLCDSYNRNSYTELSNFLLKVYLPIFLTDCNSKKNSEQKQLLIEDFLQLTVSQLNAITESYLCEKNYENLDNYFKFCLNSGIFFCLEEKYLLKIIENALKISEKHFLVLRPLTNQIFCVFFRNSQLLNKNYFNLFLRFLKIRVIFFLI